MKKNNKINGFGVIIISIISFLYILLVTKLAEILSIYYMNDDDTDDKETNQIGMYVMIIYFISIIGIVIGYIWLSDSEGNGYGDSLADSQTPNWIVRWSLSIGGVLMLIYAITNYWEYLNDYSKLLLIFLSITSIIYYLYKYY